MGDEAHAAIAQKLRLPVNPIKKHEGRKLLHYTPSQWKEWERMPQYAKLIPTAKILPMRPPLSSIYEIHYSSTQANYSPSALMERLIADARSGTVVSLGLIIDATADDHFLHDPKEWDDWDVKFVKLPMTIQEEEPDMEVYDRMVSAFCDEMERHTSGEFKDMDVGVYGQGLNGYNVVGFLSVSYLVEYCKLNLDVALQQFAAASPPGIYSSVFLERLYRKYFSTLPSSHNRIECPAPPKWDPSASDSKPSSIGPEILTEEDKAMPFVRKQRRTSITTASSSGTNTPTGNGSMRTSSFGTAPPVYTAPLYIPPDRDDYQSRPPKRRKLRSWVDEVLPMTFGETLELESEAYERVKTALEKLTGVEGFPGCEAIPLTATHIATGAYNRKGCLTKAYLVTWRARGRRCLLYVAADGTYVVSRDMSFTKVNMKFPRRRAPNEAQINTLIDGILVEDQDHDTKVSRFLAFDLVFLEGTPIWQKKLEKRLQCLQNEVILPRKNDKTFDYNKEPFRVRMKDHFRLQKTEYLLQKFVKSITHEVDGVIYTPTEAPYSLGGFESDEPLFKFVASEGGCGIPGLDGSISERRLLQYIQSIPTK